MALGLRMRPIVRPCLAAVALISIPCVPIAAETATSLKSFEGIEEPTVRYVVEPDRFEPDELVNITDVGDGTFRMMLRYRAGQWWDGDRAMGNKDRQRAEVKGLGPHQRDGERFEYATTWRTSPGLRGTDRFCHVFQLKAVDGDNKPPLVVLSIQQGDGNASLRYCSGRRRGFEVARRFQWKPATWQTVRIRVRTSSREEGELTLSVNGDEFGGATGIPLYRPGATRYRPKWGLYRGVSRDMAIGDDYVEHRNVSADQR
jgi:hypothetical protein